MATKKNEGDAVTPQDAAESGRDGAAGTGAAADEKAPQLSVFEMARNADLRHRAERAARESGGNRKAGNESTEHEATPYSLAYHPDGSEKRMVISHPDGSAEREVTVSEWDRLNANPNLAPGTWMVKYTEVIAPHHSDEF